jgi:twitching motility protein PilT
MAQVQKELDQVLIEQGLLTEDQYRLARQEESRTGESAWRILLQQGTLSERHLVQGRAAQFGLRFVDVTKESPTREALTTVPHEVAKRQMVLPMVFEEGRLVVAMAEPTNHLALQELAGKTGREIVPAAAHRQDLLEAVDRAYAPPQADGVSQGTEAIPAFQLLGEAPQQTVTPAAPVSGNGDGTGVLSGQDFPLTEAPMAAQTGPSVEVVEEEGEKEPNLADFLMYVIEGGGSDLHLTAGKPPSVRIHGELESIPGYRRLMPKDLQHMIYAILTQRQREQFEENLELDLSYQLPGLARFRVNVYQQRESLGSVMRMIPFEIKSAETLGLPPAVSEFTNLRRGLVLVTGITGSGKSTTLAALIDHINETRAEHIMTVEDPIEFLHKHKKAVVNQREIGVDTHGFAQALKHVLRQDPDIILVGEMRDLETISSALTAAETGHLVFGTLHTQDAPQSVDRVIDVFPPHQQQQIRVQLAGTMAGVVSQQLVPTIDGKGRAVAAEVLVATSAVRNLIREGKTHQIYTSMQAGGKHGMQVMDQALADLVKKGKVTYEMGLERSHHVEEFNRLVGKG